ncbi:hypothetical protein MTO96_012265 [Rhipicephalus appendiculatus]
MPDLVPVHRFRDHPIEGVNWRPTRFVDELCISRVCALCGVISMSTALLPCSHFLCQSCLVASTLGCGGRCPLDQEPFEKGEWITFDLPTTTANAFKVRCWNDVHGCEFEGSVEVMLKHYEKDCTFHTVECLRCGESVLHMELPTHYVAGCSAAVPRVGAKNPSSESRASTLEDVTTSLQELKTTMLRNNQMELLRAIERPMSERIEQVTDQGIQVGRVP